MNEDEVIRDFERILATVPDIKIAYTGVAATGRLGSDEYIIIGSSPTSLMSLWDRIMDTAIIMSKTQKVAVFEESSVLRYVPESKEAKNEQSP